MRVHLGTSGWQYRSWRGRFYPKGVRQAEELEWYADRFSCVELNNSFYRLPDGSTFAGWARRTPEDFTFVVKASRYLSHIRRLREPEEPVARLLERARPLGSKLGPILLQLPPNLPVELERLDATLACFGSVPVAVEPRHEAWFTDATYELLARHGAALCLTDRRNQRGPIVHTADWAYVRLHEGTAAPRPCYGAAALRWWVRTLAAAPANVRVGWVFFNNDPQGCAPVNAATFGRMAERAGLDLAQLPARVQR